MKVEISNRRKTESSQIHGTSLTSTFFNNQRTKKKIQVKLGNTLK